MSDLDQLRDLGGQVRPPALDSLERVARRRGHRTAGVITAACTAVLLVVGGGVVANRDDQAAPPVQPVAPTPTPSPPTSEKPKPGARTSMSPEQVVNAANATLMTAGMSLEDPAVRLSLWVAQCLDCPAPEGGGHPVFRGMALTTDGYATSTYLRSPFSTREPDLIESPAPDLFLVHDSSNGGAFLIGTDGAVRRVTSLDTPITPSDPRLWFQCLSATIPDEPTWCALDPERATSYRVPGSWGNGIDVSRPDAGEEPWGIRSGSSDTLDAWWDVDGDRQSRPLPDWRSGSVGVVRNPPGGGPMWWSWPDGSESLDVLVGRDRSAPWQVVTRAAPPVQPDYESLTGTPDGGLLAVRSWPRTKIWRADDLRRGDFSLVYDAGPGPENEVTDYVRFVGDEMRLMAGAATVTSSDDGRTWTNVSTWR
ncbi:MAG: hypothetical protein ACXWW7_09455 [Nocardioides sp.]